jgi:phenylacetate-CoA oxygenase PaaH subunit
MKAYYIFVQWNRGKPHEYAQTITAADDEMALMLAKRNIDLRAEPVDIWVAPRSSFTQESLDDDPSLTPSTDREYRNVTGYIGLSAESAD